MAFPVLGFYFGEEAHGHRYNEQFELFADKAEVGRLRRGAIRLKERIGMLIVDSDRRTWTVTGVRVVGVHTNLLARILATVFGQTDEIEDKVEYELKEGDQIEFVEVQDRVIQSIQRNPTYWIDDEALAGESGEPIKFEDVLAGAERAVRRARGLREMTEILEEMWD